jgi:hypothetical protein
VSFELVDEALRYRAAAWVAVMVLGGAAVFTVGDWLLERRGGGDRKDATGAQAEGSPLAIVLGSVLDGIPESFAAGALLTMLADTLLPEAYAVEGVSTGFLVVAGFAISLALSAI